MSPERRLVRIGARTGDLAFPPSLGPRPIVAVGGAATLPEWVRSTLLPQLEAGSVVHAAEGADLTSWWGTPRALELAAVADVTPWAGQVAARYPVEPCRWCGLPVQRLALPLLRFRRAIRPGGNHRFRLTARHGEPRCRVGDRCPYHDE